MLKFFADFFVLQEHVNSLLKVTIVIWSSFKTDSSSKSCRDGEEEGLSIAKELVAFTACVKLCIM